MDDTRSGANMAHAFPAVIIPYIARISGDMGMIPIAQRAVEGILSDPSLGPMTTLIVRTSQALIAVCRQDSEAAANVYEFFKIGPRGMPVTGIMCFERLLGLLARTIGDLDGASVHFDDALTFSRKAGYPPELAWSCSDYAETLLQRNGRGDRQNAAVLLDEALNISRDLGMRPLMERVISLQDSGAPGDGSPLAHPDGLTEREVDVLRLIASGKTNQQIGDELFISARTVANHAANIFNKTGAANRAEAATYASRNGLV